MSTAARTLAAYATGLRLDAVPGEARRCARQCLIDAVGVALLGSRLPWGRAAATYARQ